MPGQTGPEETITCVDCGGICHLVDRWEDDDFPPGPGDVVRYRCRDCLDMWYLVIPGEDDDATE